MLPPEQPDRINIAFDDHRLVANAGLLLPVALAHHPDRGASGTPAGFRSQRGNARFILR